MLNTAIVAGLYLLSSIIQLCAWSPPYAYHKGANITAGVIILLILSQLLTSLEQRLRIVPMISCN